MLCVLRFVAVCICLHESLARPREVDHNMEKRWAYIENGDPQMRSIHTDCKKIVREYSDGDMPFYEYTAKMKKCVNRQERTNIPNYEGEYFTPSFGAPKPEKRFETPRYYNQLQPSNNVQYGNYGYNYQNQNQNQNSYGSVDQRGNIASPQAPQYDVPQTQPQAQAFPATDSNQYYQQSQPGQFTARNDIPSYQEPQQEPNEQSTMYSSDIVKKDEIPKPHEQ